MKRDVGLDWLRRQEAKYKNREVKRLLGSAYSWDGELYHLGNPCVGGATEWETEMLAMIERNWQEAVTI